MGSDWNQVWLRRRLNYIFDLRDRIFFRKKRPQSKCYPYKVHDPFELFGEKHPYGDFYLVGDAWLEKDSQKPVAICWGFNDWKFGFVSAYLGEYRTAFAPRKITSIFSLIALRRFPVRPTTFVVWGYNEPWLVRLYAKRATNISVLRVEDAFLRSSGLGAEHTTPYSLVFDRTGLYYDPRQPSDLENLLNTYDFSDSDLDEARECISIVKELRLSKYNPPDLRPQVRIQAKMRPLVAVIGQVRSDRAIRLGNPNRWSDLDVIRLAKLENPTAEIVYRPHPEVFKGFQRNFFRRNRVEQFCRISSPDEPLTDFLENADQVYVLTSLVGLEALIRGKKVTVLGSAFYAGWGLTDDRIALPRRNKLRTLEELFSAVYLKYPRYLASPTLNSALAFKATALRIAADRAIGRHNALSEIAKRDPAEAAKTTPRLLSPHIALGVGPYRSTRINTELLQHLDLTGILDKPSAQLYNTFVLSSIFGRLADDSARQQFLKSARPFVLPSVYRELLLNLSKHYNGEYLTIQAALFALHEDEPAKALEGLEHQIASLSARVRIQQDKAQMLTDDENIGGTRTYQREGSVPSDTKEEEVKALDKQTTNAFLALFEFQREQKQYKEALKTAEMLLQRGLVAPLAILPQIWELAILIFDNQSALRLADLVANIDLLSRNRDALWASCNSHFVAQDPTESLITYILCAQVATLNPERVGALLALHNSYATNRDASQLIAMQLHLDNAQNAKKVFALLEGGDQKKALRLLSELEPTHRHDVKFVLLHSEICFATGREEEAISETAKCLALSPSKAAFVQGIRQLVVMGRFGEAQKLWEEAKNKGVEMSYAHLYPILQGLGRVGEAHDCYLEMQFRRDIARYFPLRYRTSLTLKSDSTLFLAAYGPGDELRFASLYAQIKSCANADKISITCDSRLLTLLRRSFPSLNFVPVKRSRSFDRDHPPELYNRLPGADLCSVLDNEALPALLAHTHTMLVTDLLAAIRRSKDDFPGAAYLIPDESLAASLRALLPKKRPLVGLSWRSCLLRHSRNVHYLSIEDLEPLFRIPNIQLVNLQYDECQEELDLVEKRYPGKLLHLPSVDLFNDFEAAAALTTCLDLVIAPATSTAELAGAIGCPTWLFGKSAELEWRRRNGSEEDLWFKNVRIVLGARYNDAASVVEALETRLQHFAETFPQHSDPTPQNRLTRANCVQNARQFA